MKNKNIQIKQIQKSDFPEVLLLWKRLDWEISNPQLELINLQTIIKINPGSCLIITRDEKIIGVILGTYNGKRGWIYHLAIHPDFQHKGYGSLLLNEAEKELKKKGTDRVYLGVYYSNLKVVPFYQKHGYSVANDALYLRKNI